LTLKIETIENLNFVFSELKSVQKLIKKITGKLVQSQEIKERANEVSLLWYEKIKSNLTNLDVKPEIVEKFEKFFEKLLHLSLAATSRKTTFSECVENITKDLKKDLLAGVMKYAGDINQISQLEKIKEKVTEAESEYLDEAISCANMGFNRASVVLGWSAIIARIQKVIEKLGFDTFNQKSLEMKNKTSGRYKRFGKSFTVNSISELQSVFDNDLLWVLEYWGLIDPNQHERLSLCFTMRNNSAHPGEAIITPENLTSFYSDLKTIIFDNEKFKITDE